MPDYTKINFAYSCVPGDHANVTCIMPSTMHLLVLQYSNNTS